MELSSKINSYLYPSIGLVAIFSIAYRILNNPPEQDLIETLLDLDAVFFAFVGVLSIMITLWNHYTLNRSLESIDMIDELEQRLSYTNIPFVIRIINADIPQLSDSISERIFAADVWDWTFVGSHPDYQDSPLSDRLGKSLENQYLQHANLGTIQTSTICFLDEYPWGHKNYLFFGTLSVPKQSSQTSFFPKLPVSIQQRNNWGMEFSAMYEYNARKNGKMWYADCISPKNTDDIRKHWSKIRKEFVRLDISDALSVSWTDKDPNVQDVESFRQAILEQPNSSLSSPLILYRRMKRKSIVEKGKVHAAMIPVFSLGYILSPISFYNDSFVNLPLSFTLGSVLYRSLGTLNYPTWVSISYVTTNVFGLLLMWLALRNSERKLDWEFVQQQMRFKFLLLTVFIGILAYTVVEIYNLGLRIN